MNSSNASFPPHDNTMFSALLSKMEAVPLPPSRPEVTRASSSESILSTITVDASDPQSSSSTPPTSIGDGVSVSSTSLKLETANPTPVEEPAGRTRRPRASVPTYNVKVLSGTAVHAPRKYCKNEDGTPMESRRRTISGDTLVGAATSLNASSEAVGSGASGLVRERFLALDRESRGKKLTKSKSQNNLAGNAKKSAKQLEKDRRRSTRSVAEKAENLSAKLGVLGKRSRKTFEDGVSAGLVKVKRELRNLVDTPEYAKIDTKPVIHQVWSNGKLVTEERPKKRKKVEEEAALKVQQKAEEPKPVEKKKPAGKTEKVWLSMGLYAGQDGSFEKYQKSRQQKRKATAEVEVDTPNKKPRKVLPLPLWRGQQLLQTGRDFKLPFDVCSPLPPGQPKPDEWRKTSSNRFVGDASSFWKKADIFDSFSSKCVCKPENGCDERCQNRIMLYECDDGNCAVGRQHCTNRAFADLQDRRKGGGKYRIGVEVIKTADRGYGVRSNRCFDANQIIVEYTGEVITEEECDRRMNEDYKDNECYYLMSFDQNMILDGTKGSIARFVNHSCKPNCRMVKWVVGSKPRMALFVGDKPIMTGEELTYDYNFDPFSAKNVQTCRCGSDNCRGVLGPKPKDQKLVKEAIKDSFKAGVKAGIKAGKRKLNELLGGENASDPEDRTPKKRKIKEAKGAKRSASTGGTKGAKITVKAIKKRVSAKLFNARQPTSAKRSGPVIPRSASKGSPLKTYSKRQVSHTKATKQTKLSSRNSSLTIVATEADSPGTPDKMSSVGKRIVKKSAARSAYTADQGSPSRGAGKKTIRVITSTLKRK